MYLIIISGPPASGKTTLGSIIADNLDFEFLAKDEIKERLFNSGARTTYDYSWYEKRAKDLLFDNLRLAIAKNQSLVIEANFIKSDKKRLISCLNKSMYITEMYCSARGMTRFSRFVKRNESGMRHKAHYDRRWYTSVFLSSLLSYVGIEWPYKPLNISMRMNIDTTHPSKINYKKLLETYSNNQ